MRRNGSTRLTTFPYRWCDSASLRVPFDHMVTARTVRDFCYTLDHAVLVRMPPMVTSDGRDRGDVVEWDPDMVEEECEE